MENRHLSITVFRDGSFIVWGEEDKKINIEDLMEAIKEINENPDDYYYEAEEMDEEFFDDLDEYYEE